MAEPTSYDKRRVYAGERYLRSDQLMKNGRFIAVTLTIKDVIHDLPSKIMGGDNADDDRKGTKKMPGLEFVGFSHVLGLSVTNEALVCWETGEGNYSGWIGKKIQLVVRLVKSYNKQAKKFEDIPGIRIWPRRPHPSGRVRDQMGKEVSEDWYRDNGNQYVENQKSADAHGKEPTKTESTKTEPLAFTPEMRARWLEIFIGVIEKAKTQDAIDNARVRFNDLGEALKKNGLPLTGDERKSLSDRLSAAVKAVSSQPTTTTEPGQEEKPKDSLL